MRIAFYAPFKPLGHPHPSGDLAHANGIRDFLTARGHWVEPVSRLRTRRFLAAPWLWPWAFVEILRLIRRGKHIRSRIWITYHTYYKAPDLLGPSVTRQLRIPYVIFQGMYSTRPRKNLRTWPGFRFNRAALLAADHVFTNKLEDLTNLRRLLPERRLTYIKPGLFPEAFTFQEEARGQLRRSWKVDQESVILSAAMFRPGVKTDGLMVVIRVCHELRLKGHPIKLVIAGDGEMRDQIRIMADTMLPGTVEFAGRVPRSEMYRYYSAADLFAFPGIRESLGMVYLEAQSCGLPVVAYLNAGVPEVVRQDHTGLLVPFNDESAYLKAMEHLVLNSEMRRQMGAAAKRHVRAQHDLNVNYQQLASQLEAIAYRRRT